jgi:PAS domain-containing protein
MGSRSIAKIQAIRPPAALASGHAVQFYEDDAALIQTLVQHIGAALELGDTVILVATKDHRKGLAKELEARGVDTAAAIKAGRYVTWDAAETLTKFIVEDWPDKQRFEDTVGALVRSAEAGVEPGHRLVIFGEMVALLWAQGKRAATVRLEELWNELRERHSFHLLCGYPISAFDREEHRQRFFSICGEHTHVNPAASYPAQGSAKRRGRNVTRLPQKARLLEKEIRVSQERVQLLQNAAKAGTWELDLVNDTFSFSSAGAKLLGFEFASHVRLGQVMDLMYYSGDRDAVVAHLQAAQHYRKDFTTTFRVRRGAETRIIAIQGKTFYNSGTPIMLGVLSDVTPAA